MAAARKEHPIHSRQAGTSAWKILFSRPCRSNGKSGFTHSRSSRLHGAVNAEVMTSVLTVLPAMIVPSPWRQGQGVPVNMMSSQFSQLQAVTPEVVTGVLRDQRHTVTVYLLLHASLFR